MSYWTPAIQAYAVSYLMSYGGLPLYGAAGLVSRWANVEAPNGPTSRGGYMGRAWGIGQWLGPRLPPIDGNPSLDAQLAYVIQELNSSEARAAQYVRSAVDADSGAVGASAYERAAGSSTMYPRDNFTNRTAAGIARVIANAGGGSVQSASGNDAYRKYLQTGGGFTPVAPDFAPLAPSEVLTDYTWTADDAIDEAPPVSSGTSTTQIAVIALAGLVLISLLKRALD